MEPATSIGIATERFDRMVCSQCDAAMDITDVASFARVECPACGHPATVPAKLGNFLLLDLIGTGGMGSVFIAEDESLDRLVAIKVMLKTLGDNPEAVETFKREAQAAAKLNHSGIAQIYSIGQEGGQPYIVMELVAGQGLAEMIDGDKPLGEKFVMRAGLGVAGALDAANEIGLIHGDIKPENILLDDKGRPKLVDFGLASFADQAAAEGIWGTPYYIAPEKVQRRKVDARSDIYSLGATLYHALAGHPPFDGETPTEVVKARLDAPPPPLREIRPEISPEVDAIITRMLETEPSRRYPTYASLMGDMRRVCGKRTEPGRTGRLRTRPERNVSLSTRRLPRVTQNINPAAAALPPGRRPKVVVRTKKTRLSGAALQSYRQQKPGGATGGPEKPENTEAKREAERLAKARRRKRFLLSLLILVLAAGAGALAYVLHTARQRDIAARREFFAVAACSNLYNEITGYVSSTTGMQAEVDQLIATTTNAVTNVLEQPFSMALIKPAAAEATNALTAVSDAGAGEEGAATNPPPATDADNEAPTAADDAEAAQAEEQADADDADKDQAADAAAARKDDILARIAEHPFLNESIDDLDVIQLARTTFQARRALDRIAAAMKPTVADATLLIAGTKKKQTSDDLHVTRKSLEAKRDIVRDQADLAQRVLARARDATERAEKLARNAVADRAAARKAAADTAAEKARREAAARAAAERQAKVQSDMLAVTETRRACLPFVQRYQFDRAVASARQAAERAQTDAGKQAFDVLIERHRRLVRLKDFLVQRLNKDPQPWIWVTGRSAKDVIEASHESVTLRGGVRVSWSEVTVPQMLKFIDVYTSSRKVRIRQQCNQLVAAAIFCIEYGGSDRARAAARNYANKAVAKCNDVQDDTERLLDFEWTVD